MESTFKVEFHGLDADKHLLDARQFGTALLGIDKIVNVGLLSLTEGRFPNKGERYPLQIKAGEPLEGSVEIVMKLMENLSVGLPLVHEVINTKASELITHWISWVFKMGSGKEDSADPHFIKLMELTEELNRSRAQSDSENRQFFLDVLDRLSPALKETVSPVGPSASHVTFLGRTKSQELISTTVDIPMADTVRTGEKLEIGDIETFHVQVDGLVHHSKQLKVVNPEFDGKFLNCSVQDPIFLESDNVYVRAVSSKGWLEVVAKSSRKKDGSLHSLYIMDAKLISAPNSL